MKLLIMYKKLTKKRKNLTVKITESETLTIFFDVSKIKHKR